MTIGVCIVCVRIGRIELHHLAGRVYQSWLVVPVCVPCHRFLHGRLAAAGIDLKAPVETPTVRAWALLRGTSDVLAAAFLVRGQPGPAATLAGWSHDLGDLLALAEAGVIVPRPLITLGLSPPRPRRLTPTQETTQAGLLRELAADAQHALDDEHGG